MTASVPAPAAPMSTSPFAQATGGPAKGAPGAAAAFEAMMDAFLAGMGEPVAAPAQDATQATVAAPSAAMPLLIATDEASAKPADAEADGKGAEEALVASDAAVPAPAMDMTLAMAALMVPPVVTPPVTPTPTAPVASQTGAAAPLLAKASLVPTFAVPPAPTGVAEDAEAAAADSDPDFEAAPADLPLAAEPAFSQTPVAKAAAPSQGQAKAAAAAAPAAQAASVAPVAAPKDDADVAAPASDAVPLETPAASAAQAQSAVAQTTAAPLVAAAAAPAPAAPAKPAEPATPTKTAAKDGERVEAFAAGPAGPAVRTPATTAGSATDTTTSSHADQGPVLEAAADAAPAGPAHHEPEATQAPAATTPSVSTPVQHAAASVVRGSPETVAALSAQILKKLEGRSTRFDLELHPADLGKVDVRVEIGTHGRMTAALQFDNPQAAAELKSRAGELQKALELAGFDMSGGMSFDVAGDPQGQASQQQLMNTGGGDAGAAFRGRAFQAALDTANEADAAPVAMGNLYLRRGLTAGVDVRI